MRHFLTTTACAMMITTPAIVQAEAGATEILEEIFGLYGSNETRLLVVEKLDKRGYTEWRDITVATTDQKMVATVPWIRVTKKLLGGHDMTIANETSMVLLPDLESGFPGMEFVFGFEDLITEISGQQGERAFAGTAKAITIKSKNERGPLFVDAVLNELQFNEVISSGGERPRVKTDGTVQSMSVRYSFSDDEMKFSSEGKAGQLTMATDMVFPTFGEAGERAEFEPFAASYSLADGDFTTIVESPGTNMNIAAKFAGTKVEMKADDAGFGLTGLSNGVDYQFTMPEAGLPPISASVETVEMAMGAPLNNMDSHEETKLKIGFNQLVVSEDAWAMFDPTKAIPRDPATLDIAVSGMMKWLIPFEELDTANPPGEVPVEFKTAKVEALNLSIGGAELVTQGDFTIDNSQPEPRATGKLDASLAGGQTLMNKLVEIGWLEQAQAFAVMGMAMMFAKADPNGADRLETTIELTEDGGVKANGVQIR